MSEDRFSTTGWDREQVRRSAYGSGAYRSADSRGAGAGSSGSQGRGQGGQQPKRRRRRGSPVARAVIYVACVVIASALIAGVGWLLANDLCALNKEYKEAEITVTEEDTVGSVTDKLKDAGLIEYKWFFRLFCAIASADEKIDPGTYTMNTDMDYRALISAMDAPRSAGERETVRVTIPEGYTVRQIIDALAEAGVNTAANLEEAAMNYEFDYEFVDNENLGDITRLEGYLFPDTYDFYVGEQAYSALGRLLDNFQRKMDADILELVENSGYTMREILTIASLIEKETDGTDRNMIASVIYNRLNNPSYETGGLLQIDAALVYATGHGELTAEDMQLDSPYNLYTNAGLPPTPICNPGLESITAALMPAETDYYYYVLGSDGTHIYSRTYAEHQQVIASLG